MGSVEFRSTRVKDADMQKIMALVPLRTAKDEQTSHLLNKLLPFLERQRKDINDFETWPAMQGQYHSSSSYLVQAIFRGMLGIPVDYSRSAWDPPTLLPTHLSRPQWTAHGRLHSLPPSMARVWAHQRVTAPPSRTGIQL